MSGAAPEPVQDASGGTPAEDEVFSSLSSAFTGETAHDTPASASEPVSTSGDEPPPAPCGSAPQFTRVRIIARGHEHAGKPCAVGDTIAVTMDAGRRLVAAGRAEYV